MVKYQAVRGTKDILPAEALHFQKLESTARSLFGRFGFDEIRTPTFETVDLFQRSLGETTDVVQKEMYVFEDRGGRKLSLRPEGTAGVVRAFIEHHLSQNAPVCKLFYIGQMFRAERPQAGRYREFWQIGGEYFGNASPVADAEVLLFLHTLYNRLGLIEARLKINSLGDANCRPQYIQALQEFLKTVQNPPLCEDCLRRIDKNPLRALDCKIDGPRIEKDVPQINTYWCEPCRKHFDTVRHLLDKAGAKYEVSPRLVRGLDYYTRTVFEVTTTLLGAQDALAAGGRYDRLVKELGGPDVPAIGFALGSERTIEALKVAHADQPARKEPDALRFFVAALGETAIPTAFQVLALLRTSPELAAKKVLVEGGFFDKKLGGQLTIAARMGSTHCVILGDDEVQKGDITLKDLRTSKQESLKQKDLLSHLLSLATPA